MAGRGTALTLSLVALLLGLRMEHVKGRYTTIAAYARVPLGGRLVRLDRTAWAQGRTAEYSLHLRAPPPPLDLPWGPLSECVSQ